MANGQTFHDALGRTWMIMIRIPAIRRVREMTGIDLTDFSGGKLFSVSMDDAEKLVGVLWALVEPEAKKLNVEPDDFGSSLDGECLAIAGTALMKELIAFAPPHRRKVMQAALDEISGAINDAADKSVEQIKKSNLRKIILQTTARQIQKVEDALNDMPAQLGNVHEKAQAVMLAGTAAMGAVIQQGNAAVSEVFEGLKQDEVPKE